MRFSTNVRGCVLIAGRQQMAHRSVHAAGVGQPRGRATMEIGEMFRVGLAL